METDSEYKDRFLLWFEDQHESCKCPSDKLALARHEIERATGTNLDILAERYHYPGRKEF